MSSSPQFYSEFEILSPNLPGLCIQEKSQKGSARMGEKTYKIDVDNLIACSDDLVSLLHNNAFAADLAQCRQLSDAFDASSDSQFRHAHDLVQDYERRIRECKEETEKARSVISNDETESLRREYEVELENERLLEAELSVILKEVNELERERRTIDEREQGVKKLEEEESRAERKLSMYASVTNIVPCLDTSASISGYIVHRDKKVVDKFEFDPTKMTQFDICQSIWKMIDP